MNLHYVIGYILTVGFIIAAIILMFSGNVTPGLLCLILSYSLLNSISLAEIKEKIDNSIKKE